MTKRQATELVAKIEAFIVDGQLLGKKIAECIDPSSVVGYRASLDDARAGLAEAFVEATGMDPRQEQPRSL